jgi:hypothetical protein
MPTPRRICLQRAVQVPGRLGVHRHDGRASRDDFRQEPDRLVHHEMRINRQARGGDCGQYWRSDRQLRAERPVHHIDVRPAPAAVQDADFLAQPGQVGGEDTDA